MSRIDLWLCLWLAGVTLSIQVPASPVAPMREAHADLPGVRLWYRDSGGTGVPVVFMHAATGSSGVWEHQIPSFTAAGYRFIALDRRGYGRTIVDPSGPQPGTAADDLQALIGHLGIDRFHLIGTAAGGFGALDYALSFPQRVRSLVIANSIGGVQDEDYLALGRRIRPPEFLALPPDFRELGPSSPRRQSRRDTAMAGARACKPRGWRTAACTDDAESHYLCAAGESAGPDAATHRRCRPVLTAVGHAPLPRADQRGRVGDCPGGRALGVLGTARDLQQGRSRVHPETLSARCEIIRSAALQGCPAAVCRPKRPALREAAGSRRCPHHARARFRERRHHQGLESTREDRSPGMCSRSSRRAPLPECAVPLQACVDVQDRSWHQLYSPAEERACAA